MITQFRESLRYEYPLTKDSVVVDAGFHKGVFSKEIFERYNCKVLAFEPIIQFAVDGAKIVSGSKIQIHNVGLGNSTRSEVFKIKGDMTGIFADGPEYQVRIVKADEALSGIGPIDLLKLNIEGSEYEVIDNLHQSGFLKNIRFLQIQFHAIHADAGAWREKALSQIAETHNTQWSFPFCWESFERR